MTYSSNSLLCPVRLWNIIKHIQGHTKNEEIYNYISSFFLRPLKKPHIGSFNANLDATSKRFNCSKSENIHTLLTTAGLCP